MPGIGEFIKIYSFITILYSSDIFFLQQWNKCSVHSNQASIFDDLFKNKSSYFFQFFQNFSQWFFFRWFSLQSWEIEQKSLYQLILHESLKILIMYTWDINILGWFHLIQAISEINCQKLKKVLMEWIISPSWRFGMVMYMGMGAGPKKFQRLQISCSNKQQGMAWNISNQFLKNVAFEEELFIQIFHGKISLFWLLWIK